MLPASFNLQVADDPTQETLDYAQVLRAAFAGIDHSQVTTAFEQVSALAEAMEMEGELPALHALASAYEGQKAEAIQYSTVPDAEVDSFGESLAFMAHSTLQEVFVEPQAMLDALQSASRQLVGEALPEQVSSGQDDTDVSGLDLSDADLAAAVAILNPHADAQEVAEDQLDSADVVADQSEADQGDEEDELAQWAKSGWDLDMDPEAEEGQDEAGFADWHDDRFDDEEDEQTDSDDLDDWDY